MGEGAELIAAIGMAAGALAVVATIHDRLVDAGADVVLVASLATLSHAAFRLVDDHGENRGEDRDQHPRGG